MNISEGGLNFIKRFEGFSSKPYICVGGHKTIGYGHILKKSEKMTYISEDEASDLLKKDVKLAGIYLLKLTKIPLNQNQFDALSSFIFNLGSAAYERSALRSKLNRGEYNAVPQELMRWIYSNGKEILGLINRRKAESLLYLK